MKSVELTKEAWGGVPADKEAFTLDDEKTLFFSKDIQTLPAVLATLKGLRELVSATAIAVKDEAGEDVAAGKELSIGAGDKLKVKIAFTPAYALYDCTWASGDATKVKVTKIDECSALIEPVAANATAITITATAASGVTATCTIKPVA